MKDMSANFEKVIDKNGGSASAHNDEIAAQIVELRGLINDKKNVLEGEIMYNIFIIQLFY